MIVQPERLPPGWAIGITSSCLVTAVHYFPREGWFDGYWITLDGEECCAVDDQLRPIEIPNAVRTICQLMHRALERPCPWESETT